MTAYEGPAVLRWRANRSTAFDGTVKVVVTETRTGWLVKVEPSTQDDLWFIETFPNPWELVFPDGSSFEVEAHRDGHVWLVTAADD